MGDQGVHARLQAGYARDGRAPRYKFRKIAYFRTNGSAAADSVEPATAANSFSSASLTTQLRPARLAAWRHSSAASMRPCAGRPLVKRGDPDGQRQPRLLVGGAAHQLALHDGMAKLFGDADRRRQAGLRQDDRERIVPVARGDVAAGDRFLDHHGDEPQHAVADDVAVVLIDDPDVSTSASSSVIGSSMARHSTIVRSSAARKIATVAEAGEGIGLAFRAQLDDLAAKLSDLLGHRLQLRLQPRVLLRQRCAAPAPARR